MAATFAVSAAFAVLATAHSFSAKPKGSALMVVTQDTASCRKMQDPLNFLEEKKTHIQEQVRAGKMTQEEADAKIARIEEKIKAILTN